MGDQATQERYLWKSGNGAEWLKKAMHAECSELGAAVADLLDALYAGIYHLPQSSLKKVEWENSQYVSIVVPDGYATFDFGLLTRLVVLCHDRCIRGEINAAAPHYFRLMFHPRTRAGDHAWARHPTMSKAVRDQRDSFGWPPEAEE